MTDELISSWRVGRTYESTVAEVLSKLELFRAGCIYRNRKYEGKGQPGKYEIDIALEVLFDGVLAFLLIVECKNQERPVDRPAVQQVLQTREAISAHKAAIASSVGFTKEAVELADAKGVALWVIEPEASESAMINRILYCIGTWRFSEKDWVRDADGLYEVLSIHRTLFLAGYSMPSAEDFQMFIHNNPKFCLMCLSIADELLLAVKDSGRWMRLVLFCQWRRRVNKVLKLYGDGLRRSTRRRAIATLWQSDSLGFKRATFEEGELAK